MSDARLDLLVRASWPHLVRTAYLLTGSVTAAEVLARDAVRRRLATEQAPVPETALRDAVVREAFRHRALYAAGSAPFAEPGDALARVRAALRQLPLDERAVLVLRQREGLSVEQAVDVLRVPRGVVLDRDERAVRALGAAGLLPQEEISPGQLRQLLDAVAEAITPPQPPDLTVLLASGAGGRGRRLLLIGATAAAVCAVVVTRWL